MTSETVAIIGLGYVGLPAAVSLAKKYPVIGFDLNADRIAELVRGEDATCEVEPGALRASSVTFTSDVDDLKPATFFIVAVPTPIDADNRPDLRAMTGASRSIGKALKKGDVVVYESTVYPGVTEDICGPILEEVSGLTCGKDFHLGYSPERINPGDKKHTFETIMKVVSGQDAATLDRVADVYGSVVTGGIHRAPSIKVAEAAKVIENTQRDLNIALMNELSIIFERMEIRTKDVLDAAATKWNFLRFEPGLVGGHCIGVDPYYLTTKAQQLGYTPQVILAGRVTNNQVGSFVAQRTLKMLARAGLSLTYARIGVLGLTFKENVPDLRNTRVPDIIREFRQFGIDPLVHCAWGDPELAKRAYDVQLRDWDEMCDLDALILAVPHDQYLERGAKGLSECVHDGGVFVDVKSRMEPSEMRADLRYWSL